MIGVVDLLWRVEVDLEGGEEMFREEGGRGHYINRMIRQRRRR